MLLIINTAQPNQTTIGLSKSSSLLFQETWQTKFHESEKLLSAIDKLLKKSKNKLTDLKGIIVVTGPGSFSALRIGINLANTLSYALKIPIVGVRLSEFKNPEELVKVGERWLKKTKAPAIIEPHYGKQPNITNSKK